MEENLLDKYKAEVENDLEISDFNIKDVQTNLPANKHKWASRIIDYKIELSKLKKLREEALDKLSEKIRNESVALLTDIAIKKKAEKADLIKKIDEKIENGEIMLEYLTKIEKIYNNASFDMRNLIDIKKMES